MDLTYMPGELDYKNNKTGGIDMKREHDSVDDFEHLDPELSPGEALSKDFPGLDKDDVKPEGPSTKMLSIDHDILKPLIEASSEEVSESFTKPASSLAGNVVSSHDLITDFDSELRPSMTNLGSDSAEKSDLLDFGVGESVASNSVNPNLVEDKLASTSFISAEMESKIFKTENESDLPITSLESKSKENIKDIEGSFSTMDDSNVISLKDNDTKSQEFDSDTTKSMKEADALSQYDIKYDRKETVDQISTMGNDQEVFFKTEEQVPKPQTVIPTPEAEPSKLEPPKEQSKVHEEDKSPEKDKPFIAICPSKPTSATTEPTTKTTEKTSVSDLDDIIGPEDVFKRIGLDAWFTPERLHPIVEALVYWRDPKKSGVVFGGIMAILLSLCYMSLISVVAYSSMLALTGTICFRIYKNILQAVQKTSEGHPFKEFLDLELSLPQDKVREMVDTAVVHVNASIVELRRLFLVEDLIDSIKFGVCLWCLTYVGAIFNGMTLVILAFVALFTVPKIYENNKASIDTYIEMGRSKVEEITSKVKAAVPIGKKEPEKDKEQ